MEIIILVVIIIFWLSLFANVSQLVKLQQENNNILRQIYNLNYYHFKSIEDKAKD